MFDNSAQNTIFGYRSYRVHTIYDLGKSKRKDHIFQKLVNLYSRINQRTNGPVNAHLISWPSKAQNKQNLKIYGKEMTLTFKTQIPA